MKKSLIILVIILIGLGIYFLANKPMQNSNVSGPQIKAELKYTSGIASNTQTRTPVYFEIKKGAVMHLKDNPPTERGNERYSFEIVEATPETVSLKQIPDELGKTNTNLAEGNASLVLKRDQTLSVGHMAPGGGPVWTLSLFNGSPELEKLVGQEVTLTGKAFDNEKLGAILLTKNGDVVLENYSWSPEEIGKEFSVKGKFKKISNHEPLVDPKTGMASAGFVGEAYVIENPTFRTLPWWVKLFN